MLKWFNKKKKDNKGFTLVELIIVVAILAILVGLLAPQYVKYVEKSRQAADVSNLESLVEGFKVAAADVDYHVIPETDDAVFTITITHEGTEIVANDKAVTDAPDWKAAIKEYTGFDFSKKVTDLKLKSSKWKQNDDTTKAIGATVTIKPTGAVSVTYNPEAVKDASNK